MAKSKNDETANKVMWIVGGATVSALAMFFVNKHLNEREELKRLQLAEASRKAGE